MSTVILTRLCTFVLPTLQPFPSVFDDMTKGIGFTCDHRSHEPPISRKLNKFNLRIKEIKPFPRFILCPIFIRKYIWYSSGHVALRWANKLVLHQKLGAFLVQISPGEASCHRTVQNVISSKRNFLFFQVNIKPK
jgi:hypothetical protein